MKTKHTKGSWEIEEREHGFYVCSGFKGFVIADVTGDQITHFIGNKEEAEANAKLIAAAPEMLEALLEAKRMYEELEPAGGWQGVYEQIEDAIKKATE